MISCITHGKHGWAIFIKRLWEVKRNIHRPGLGSYSTKNGIKEDTKISPWYQLVISYNTTIIFAKTTTLKNVYRPQNDSNKHYCLAWCVASEDGEHWTWFTGSPISITMRCPPLSLTPLCSSSSLTVGFVFCPHGFATWQIHLDCKIGNPLNQHHNEVPTIVLNTSLFVLIFDYRISFFVLMDLLPNKSIWTAK